MDLRTRTEHFPPNARWADVRREYTTHTGLNQVASLFLTRIGLREFTFRTFAITRLSTTQSWKAIMNAAKIKDEIRYMSRNDKVEIYRWLDGELAGDLPSRIGSRRSIAIRREIERAWRVESKSEKPN